MRCLLAFSALVLVACSTNEANSLEGNLVQARSLLDSERYSATLDHADGWLRKAERSRDLKWKWRFALVKAEALIGKRQSESALALLGALPETPPTAEWASERARSLLLQASAAYLLGRYEKVSPLLDRARTAALQAGNHGILGEIERRRGILLSDEGKFGEADLAYHDVLTRARRIHDHLLEARVQNNLGVLLLDESRYEEAIPVFEQCRLLARQIGAADTAARAQGNMGTCYERLGDYDNAHLCFDTAQEEFSRSGNPYEVQIWAGLAGNLYYDSGDFSTAMQFYQRALPIALQVKSPLWAWRWLNNLASISIEQKAWDAAEKYHTLADEQKQKIKDAEYDADSVVNAAEIAAGRGELDRARDLFTSVLHRASEDPKVVLDTHAGLARLYARRGQLVQAESEFRNTLAEIELRQSKLFRDEFRLSWLDSLISFYQKYVDFLMAALQPERALEAAESSRSKVLTGQPVRQLTAPGFRELANRTGTVLLEYWLGQESSYLWVITPGKVICHRLPPKSEILPLVRHYRAVVTAGRNPLEVAADTGLKLYDALLAPAMADAGAATQFIIVPDDELYSLNFETLPDGSNFNRFWIDRATVRISPSLNYLAANTPRTPQPAITGMLLIGDPVSSLPQYPHLEFARQEISAIASAMAAAQPVAVQGAAATPESYFVAKPGRFGFIHFSAHAAAAARRASALDSAVILSGPPDKCRLVARDVLSIPLHAQLVTVSACRSAGGKTYGGEGLVGFAWAFMKAGAGNVIAGLWDVNDRSTVQLMTGLYTRIAAGAPVAEALRSAKLALIHGGGSYSKPFYWAPFQLYTGRAR